MYIGEYYSVAVAKRTVFKFSHLTFDAFMRFPETPDSAEIPSDHCECFLQTYNQYAIKPPITYAAVTCEPPRSVLRNSCLINKCAPWTTLMFFPFKLVRCSLEEDFRRLIPRPIYLRIPVSGRSTLSCLTYARVFSLRSLRGTCTTLPVPTLVFYYAPIPAIYRRRWEMLLKSLDASGRKVGNEGPKAPSWNPVLRSALSDVKRRWDAWDVL
jgi:hypothetical protein